MTFPVRERLAIISKRLVEEYDPLRKACEEFQILSNLRLAHFLGQCAHESGGFTRMLENLNYKADALIKMYSRARISEADAQKYGRTETHPADPKGIANCIYGGAWGEKNLGNRYPNDGWNFRGAGPLQSTGRANRAKASKAIYGDDRLVLHPELAERPEAYWAISAFWWYDNKMNTLADADQGEDISDKVNTGSIHGVAHGREERARWTNEIKGALGMTR